MYLTLMSEYVFKRWDVYAFEKQGNTVLSDELKYVRRKSGSLL